MGITVEVTTEGLIEINHQKYVFGAPVGSVLMIERGSADWLADVIDAAIRHREFCGAQTSIGGDSLEVQIGGHEMDPVVNIDNKRPDKYSFVSLQESDAEAVRDRLLAIARQKPPDDKACAAG